MQGKLSHPTYRGVLPLPRPSTKKLFLFLLEKPVVCWSCSQNSQNRIAHPAKPAGPKLTPFRRGSRREEAIEISRNPRHPFKISFSPPFKRGKKRRRGEGAPNSLSPPTWQGWECFASAASSNGSEGPARKKRKENGSRVADLKSRRTNPLETQRRRRRRREGALLMPKVFSSSVRASASFFISGPLCCPPAAVIGNRGGNVFLSFFRPLTLDFPLPVSVLLLGGTFAKVCFTSVLRNARAGRPMVNSRSCGASSKRRRRRRNTLQRWGKGESG